jgi:uncharacterized protein
MKFIGLLFSCLLFFSLPSCADDAKTFDHMLVLANKGDAEAQYHVGMMYNNGLGTQHDPRQAFEWFQKSAASDDPLGAYKLGCYYAGQFAGVVNPDPEQALKYKRVAATAGYSLAQHDVAAIYSRRGNFEEAVKWLKLAAEQGLDMSFYGLYRSYDEGKGVPRDLPLAYINLKLALLTTRMTVTESTITLVEEMAAKMSEAELAEAQRNIDAWQPRPTALTIKAKGGIEEAEEYLRRSMVE